jgi:hypothetical protein
MPLHFPKAIALFTMLWMLAAFTASAQAPAIQWQKSLGGSASERAQSIQPTTDGGYIIAGSSSSTNGDVTGNHGAEDGWVVKLNASGTMQWQRVFGGTGTDVLTDIGQTTDGGYVAVGYTASTDGDITFNHGYRDVWILKVDSTGSLEWQKTFGGTNDDEASSVQQVSDGGYILAGSTTSVDGDVTNMKGFGDCWVVRLNATGILLWQKTLGGSLAEGAQAIQQTTDKGFIVGGYTNSGDGDVTLPQGNFDGWVVKLDTAGAIQWQKTVGSSIHDLIYSIEQTPDGGYITGGKFQSPVNGNARPYSTCWVTKLSSTGIVQWQKMMATNMDHGFYSAHCTRDSGYIIASAVTHPSGNLNGLDSWVAKLDRTGALQWEKSMGGTGADGASCIEQTADGGYIMAGYSGIANGDVTANQGGPDYWVVKLSPYPAVVSNPSFREAAFSISPNPATGLVHIQSSERIESVLLTDLSGTIAYQTAGRSAAMISIPTMALANGLYLVQITTQHGTQTQKLLVQH